MATISENLQTIADSTSAIKQAIIDKGGDITGDITTWASAIEGISGGGGNSEENINNVYVSLSSSYANISPPGSAKKTIFISFEKPVDTKVGVYIQSHDGANFNSNSLKINAGESEGSVEVDLDYSLTFAVSIIPCYYMGDIIISSYLYKINYL